MAQSQRQKSATNLSNLCSASSDSSSSTASAASVMCLILSSIKCQCILTVLPILPVSPLRPLLEGALTIHEPAKIQQAVGSCCTARTFSAPCKKDSNPTSSHSAKLASYLSIQLKHGLTLHFEKKCAQDATSDTIQKCYDGISVRPCLWFHAFRHC